jgi:hypothetical protein
MALWTVFISGFVLSLYSAGFAWFRLASLTDWALHLKILFFIPVAFANYFLSASYKELRTARATLQKGEDLSPRQITEWRIIMLRRINVYLAFAIIIFIAML